MTGTVLRHTASTGSLRGPKRQVTSNLVSSAAYSFGKPKHRKGKFQIPVLDNRSPEYIPGYTGTPGAGAYETHDTLARHDTKYGHPQCRKAPAYGWSLRTDPRDVINPQPAHGSDPATTRNRFTSLSHVRSDSFLDVPGPGSYLGLNDGMRHKIPGKTQMDMPSYTMRPKCAKVENNPRFPPGPGPFEYDTRHKHCVSNNRQPTLIIPKAKRVSEALLPFGGSPEEVGPGSYEHSTALLSKFGMEAYEHRRNH
jgi:hypothetical protein